MNTPSLMLVESPELDDETASEMLDFLYQLVNAFENQYGNQLRRHQQSAELPQPDLFEEFDDELPTF
jgi:FKBP-type peptidyl-prolyl cis-trans isomerase (trigger factor)